MGEESEEALGRLLSKPNGVELHLDELRTRLLILRFDDGGNDLLGGWGAGDAKDDAAVFADDDHGPADAIPFRFQRVVGAGHLQSFVDQEIEGQLLLLDERQVAGGVRLIDPVGLGVDGSKRFNGAAHGGELVRSACRPISRVEEERGAPFAE